MGDKWKRAKKGGSRGGSVLQLHSLFQTTLEAAAMDFFKSPKQVRIPLLPSPPYSTAPPFPFLTLQAGAAIPSRPRGGVSSKNHSCSAPARLCRGPGSAANSSSSSSRQVPSPSHFLQSDFCQPGSRFTGSQLPPRHPPGIAEVRGRGREEWEWREHATEHKGEGKGC